MSKEIIFVHRGQIGLRKGVFKETLSLKFVEDLFEEVKDVYKEKNIQNTLLHPTKETQLDTKYTQLSSFLYSQILIHMLEQEGYNIPVHFGHSLGGISAAVSAGFLNIQNGLILIQNRSKLMNKLSEIHGDEYPHMIHLEFKKEGEQLGLEKNIIENLTQQINAEGFNLSIAGYNSPYQFTLSGAPEVLKGFLKSYYIHAESGLETLIRIPKDSIKEMIQFVESKLQKTSSESIKYKPEEIEHYLKGSDVYFALYDFFENHGDMIKVVKDIPVGLPFHSSYLGDVVREFTDCIAGIKFSTPNDKTIYISDFNGEIVSDPNILKSYLISSIFNPVRFDRAVESAKQFELPFVTCPMYSKILKDYDGIEVIDAIRNLKIKM